MNELARTDTPPPTQALQLGALAVAPEAVIQRATIIATALASVIESRKLFAIIRTKQGPKKYVKVEGWNTLGAMLGVLPREVSVQAIENGWEARVELIRTSDCMVIGGGSAICLGTEHNWTDRDAFAIRSMAITRATGKAFRLGFSWIIALAGYEATPAEEMIDARADAPCQGPAHDMRSTDWPRPGAPPPPQQPPTEAPPSLPGPGPLTAVPLPPSGSHFVLEATQEEGRGTSTKGEWIRYSVTASGRRFSTFEVGTYNLVAASIGRTAAIKYKLQEKYDPLIDSLVLVAPESQECRQAAIQDIESGNADGRQYWVLVTDKGRYGTFEATIGNRAIELKHLGKTGRITYRVTERGGNEIVDLVAEEKTQDEIHF